MPADRPITVRDLLTFRMGFGGYFEPYPVNVSAAPLQRSVGPPQPSLPPEPDEWMRRFSPLPLMCQPGERWLYHTGADVLGVLIARASGKPFEEFSSERIFEPLGMKDTAFCVKAADIGRLVTSYSTDPQTGTLHLYDEPAGQWSTPPAFPSRGAGLGTKWRNDPSEQMVSMLLTNAAWTSPRPPDIALDFLTGAYAAIDD